MAAATHVQAPNNYFALQRKMFKIIGIAFEQNESGRYKIYSRIFLLCTIVTYPLIQVIDIYKSFDNMDVLSNNLTYASIAIVGLGKCSLLFSKRRIIGKMVDKLEGGVFAPDYQRGGNQEAVLIKRCVRNINLQSHLFLGSVYFYITLGFSTCVYLRVTKEDYHDWKFPLGYFSLFNVTHSPNYEMALVYQTFGVGTCCVGSILCDMLMTGLIAHISTQYVILKNSISAITEIARKKMLKDLDVSESGELLVDEIPWKYLQETLKEAIEYHTAIVELAGQFEENFSYLLLAQFLTSTGTLCFLMYYCSSLGVTDSSFVQYFGGAVDIAIQVFFYCYWGNEVAIDSGALVTACYESDFVGTDLRFQKGLLLIMERSQRPIVFTAAKFTTLSLETYIWIIRASYSYFMVLYRLK